MISNKTVNYLSISDRVFTVRGNARTVAAAAIVVRSENKVIEPAWIILQDIISFTNINIVSAGSRPAGHDLPSSPLVGPTIANTSQYWLLIGRERRRRRRDDRRDAFK